MSHTIKEKKKLLGRVRRIRGQVEALERALEDERAAPKSCNRLLRYVAPSTGSWPK